MDEAELKQLNEVLRAKGAPLMTAELAEQAEFPFECMFEPTEEFDWAHDGKLVARYYPGNTYNCTRFPVHAVLRKKVYQWAQEGKVAVGAFGAGRSFIMTAPTEG